MPPRATARGTLADALTAIAKDTETIVGAEIACASYSTITFWIDYVNGDETTLLLTPYYMYSTGGTAYSDQDWSAASGTKTIGENVYAATATANLMITLDIKGIEFIKLMATADNTGTPTGTLAATYTLTGD